MSEFATNNKIQPEIPPNNLEAERGVISCMIFDSEGIVKAYENLQEDDFYNLENRVIFKAIVEMYSQNIPVDIITLKNKIESMNMLHEVGGFEYLVELSNIVSTSALVSQYSEIVKEKSTRRKILAFSKESRELAFDNSIEVEKAVDKIIVNMEQISKVDTSSYFTHIEKILHSSLESLEELFKNKGKITGLETGFIDFDYKTNGLQKSDFILIAARPSMGKTAFVINIAENVALKKDVPVAIFSLEMSKEQIVNRMICSLAQIDSHKFRTGNISDSGDWRKMAEAIDILSEAPIYIEDKSLISINEMRAKCKKLKKEKGLGLVIIDYLQLMSGTGKNESRQQEVAAISRGLKNMAKELNVPVVALSQLSRAVEQRKPPRPMLSDLRESGAIEQDADLVCFLYREEYYEPNEENIGKAELIISKQRSGSVGTIRLNWHGQYTKFTSVEKIYNDL